MVQKGIYSFHVSSTLEKPSTVYPDKNYSTNWEKKVSKESFLDLLLSMYSNDKSAVKIGNKLTESFTCHAGVKQGCILSPALFNFSLSDLPKFLNTASSTDIMLSDK